MHEFSKLRHFDLIYGLGIRVLNGDFDLGLARVNAIRFQDEFADAFGFDFSGNRIFHAVNSAVNIRIDALNVFEGEVGFQQFAVLHDESVDIAKSLFAFDNTSIKSYVFCIPCKIFAGDE